MTQLIKALFRVAVTGFCVAFFSAAYSGQRLSPPVGRPIQNHGGFGGGFGGGFAGGRQPPEKRDPQQDRSIVEQNLRKTLHSFLRHDTISLEDLDYRNAPSLSLALKTYCDSQPTKLHIDVLPDSLNITSDEKATYRIAQSALREAKNPTEALNNSATSIQELSDLRADIIVLQETLMKLSRGVIVRADTTYADTLIAGLNKVMEGVQSLVSIPSISPITEAITFPRALLPRLRIEIERFLRVHAVGVDERYSSNLSYKTVWILGPRSRSRYVVRLVPTSFQSNLGTQETLDIFVDEDNEVFDASNDRYQPVASDPQVVGHLMDDLVADLESIRR